MTRQERIAAMHKALGCFIEEAQADPSWLKERDERQALRGRRLEAKGGPGDEQGGDAGPLQ